MDFPSTVAMTFNPNFWSVKRVLITGHTGFKGGWLALLLQHQGLDLQGLCEAEIAAYEALA
jgi:nucleoside-diphosphate-sugar epimerase